MQAKKKEKDIENIDNIIYFYIKQKTNFVFYFSFLKYKK
jgi:hypothetical protein